MYKLKLLDVGKVWEILVSFLNQIAAISFGVGVFDQNAVAMVISVISLILAFVAAIVRVEK